MPRIRKSVYNIIKKYMTVALLLLPAVLICFPLLLLLTGSVMDSLEMKEIGRAHV